MKTVNLNLHFQAQICVQHVDAATLVCHFVAVNNKLFIHAQL